MRPKIGGRRSKTEFGIAAAPYRPYDIPESGGGSAVAMPTIAVGLAPPAATDAAKRLTTEAPSPVTAGPTAAAGAANAAYLIFDAVKALPAAAAILNAKASRNWR